MQSLEQRRGVNRFTGLCDAGLCARLFALLPVVLVPVFCPPCWRRRHTLFQLIIELGQIHPDVARDTMVSPVAPMWCARSQWVFFEDDDFAALFELKERRVPRRVGASNHYTVSFWKHSLHGTAAVKRMRARKILE